MNIRRVVKFASSRKSVLGGFGAAERMASAQSVQGVINGRNGATMTVQTQGAGNTVVLLTDNTQVEDVSGMFHARKKQMSMTALVPGLQVRCKGTTTPRTSWWRTPSSSMARACKPLLTFKLAWLRWSSATGHSRLAQHRRSSSSNRRTDRRAKTAAGRRS